MRTTLTVGISPRGHGLLPERGAALVIGAWMVFLTAACGGTNPDGTPTRGVVQAACNGTDPDGIPARFQPLAQAVERELASSGASGVAIAIVEKSRVSFARGFGTKTPGQQDPVKATTLFRIGSITKPLTAIALLQAVQAGQVDLDRPVVDYLPGFRLTKTPSLVPGITVRHLLTHTSGLFDGPFEWNAPADERTDDALESYLTGRFAGIGYVQSPPGAFWAYANQNFMLAGLIAQKVTGTSYRQLMHERVFEPLGMHRTVFLPSEVFSDGDYANGRAYADPSDPKRPDGVMHPDSYDNPWARPAGYAWSSVLDMAKLAAFLVHGREKVLAHDLWAAMTSPQAAIPQAAGTISYGFGTSVTQGLSLSSGYYSLKTVWHSGGIPGYSSYLFCIPERDFCFISLANGDGHDGAYFPDSRDVAVRTLVELPSPTAPPNVSPQPDRYASYIGTFVDPFFLGQVDIATHDGKLFIQSEKLDSTDTPYDSELQPTILDNFTFELDGQPQAVTFIADDRGEYTYLYSLPFVAVRTPAQR